MSKLVTIEIKDYIAHLLLNRPEKYNALNPNMFKAIVEAGQSIVADQSIRAVIISGAGRGFCAGLDFESFEEMVSGDAAQTLFSRSEGSPANNAQLVSLIWKQVPVPVIAAIHGVAFGGGLQIALAADVRLAASDARFSVMEIKWGLVPDITGSQTLRDLVRLDVAKELTFSGRVVEAEEAAMIGLITRICDNPLSEAWKMAQEIADKSPHAIIAGKQLLEEAWHGSQTNGLKLEESLQKTLIGSPNQIEAVMANFENRSPNFQSRE